MLEKSKKPIPPKLTPSEIRKSLQEDVKKYTTSSSTWEQWEDDILKEFVGKVPFHKLAEKLGRKYGSVKNRIYYLNLKANRFHFHEKSSLLRNDSTALYRANKD